MPLGGYRGAGLQTTEALDLICICKKVSEILPCVLQQTLLTTDHKLQSCQMRTKNNVHRNSIISNIYIMDEILLFDFQIAHLARSLTGHRRRQYMLV